MGEALRLYLYRLRRLQGNARLFLLNAVLAGFATSISGLFFNLYIDSLGMSRDFLGTLQALSPLVTLFLALPSGLLADRIGRKPALLLGRAGSACVLILFTLTVSPVAMVGLHLVRAIFDFLYQVTAGAFMVESSSAEERMTLFSAGYGLPALVGAAGYFVGGYLPGLFSLLLGLGRVSAYRATLWTVAALELLCLLPLGALAGRPRAETGGREALPEAPRAVRQELRAQAPFLRRYLATIAIAYLGAALVIPYLNLFFRDRFHLPDATLGWVFAVSQGVTGLLIALAPLVADRWGRIRGMTLTGLASIPLVLVIGFAPWPAVAVGAFWLRAGLMRIGNPLYDAFYLEHFSPRTRATASSLNQMAFNIGWALGSRLSGRVQDRYGYAPLFFGTALFYLLFLGLAYRFFAREDRKGGDGPTGVAPLKGTA